MARSCTFCHKSPPEVTLKNCAKCSATPYCSRDCQKADWKAHKKVCGKGGGNSTGTPGASRADTMLSPPKGLDQPIAKPFTRLDNNTWLHDRPEKDVYRLLIDAYRLRVEDNYNFDGDVDDDSLYGGTPNGLRGFKRFLELAGSSGLLPPWWNADKQRECEAFGMNGSSGQFQDLRCAVEKSDIIEHYGDSLFPMQLRMFAEAVYGRGPGGQNGTTMRKMMASMEK
ncbi:tudor domain-protein 1 [Achaetomium macrosporum]|uniref:Tudor domain-protein 1 n=1 Tax=Achaetomium macrosporum TaxID=79813 RepID=A0AAN7C0A7_9PEZI|nr:tudor domain-protein 1 [Achaetomium macrosporum]